MMLAVQGGRIALRIVVGVDLGHLRRSGLGAGHRFPLAEADPGTLLLACSVHVEESHGLAVLEKLVLHVAIEGNRRGTGEIVIRVLQLLAVVDADGNEAAGLGFGLVAGPLKDRNGAQCGRVLAGVRDLAGILRGQR